MKVDLPVRMYNKAAPRQPLNLGPLLLLLAALAVSCIWQLAGLPGARIQKYVPAADMPWSERGLDFIYIDAEGNWILNRVGYADRMSDYEITPNGVLTRHADKNYEGNTTDISGIPHGGTPVLSWGAKVKVRPSYTYFKWTDRLKREANVTYGEPAAPPVPEGAAPAKREEPVQPSLSLARHLPWYVQIADRMMEAPGSAVPIEVYLNRAETLEGRSHIVPVLEGHHYFPVFDSWALVEPDLWLTTDRLRYLHRLRVTQAGEDAKVALELSVPLKLEMQAERSCVLGKDPKRQLLFILLATGDRFWFDPQTLAPAGRDKLPGDWRLEYGEVGYSGPNYKLEQGWPLSEDGYQRVQGALMVVLLASLLGLTLLGRRAWKSTSATTTADTSSNGSSSATSPS